MKCFYFFAAIAALFLSCNQSPGTDASTMIPSVNKRGQPGRDFNIYSEAKNSKITITFTSKEPGQAMLSVYYSDGKLLSRKTLFVNRGANSWDYQLPFTSGGVYIIKFLMKGVERTGKVFKAGP